MQVGSYLKSRKIGWWLSSTLLLGVLTLIIFPGLRKDLIVWMAELQLEEPVIKNHESYYTLSDDDYKLSFLNSNGEMDALSNHKGEVIFINFWATWCSHCLAEMHSLERLYEKFGDKITFLFISHEDQKTVRKFAGADDYNLPFFKGYQGAEIFQIKAWPTTFIISKKGNIVLYDRGAKMWDSKSVHKLLKNLIAE